MLGRYDGDGGNMVGEVVRNGRGLGGKKDCGVLGRGGKEGEEEMGGRLWGEE